MRGYRVAYADWVCGAILTAVLAAMPVRGQIEFPAPGEFSADSVRLGFGLGFQSHRTTWGISYRAGDGGSLALRNYTEFVDISIPEPPFNPLLSNEPPAGRDSADLPLVIDFALPVRRAELALASGRVSATASLRVFDYLGVELGSLDGIEIPGSGGPEGWIRTVGVGTSAPQGISKLVVDYGDAPQPELLHSLKVEYLSRPTFRTVIPQVARGRLEQGGRLETSISIVAAGSPMAGEVRFFDQSGQPLLVAGESGIPLFDSIENGQFIETNLFDREEFQGYAVIESGSPVAVSATYSAVRGDGTLFSEAGVAGSTPALRAVGSARELRRLGTVSPGVRINDLRTALAVVNLSDQPAHVIFSFNWQGASSARTDGAYRDLPPHGQYAGFLADLLSLGGEEARGSLTVYANQPFAVTTLETRDGLPVASLPLAVVDP